MDGSPGRSLHRQSKATEGASERLPLVLRSAADVEALRANSWAVRRLPRAGPKVSIAGCDPTQARRLEARIASYIRACGCAEGAAAALSCMVVVFYLIAIQLATCGPRWIDVAAAVIGVLVAVLFGGVGKLLGLTISRLRFKRSCLEFIRSLDTQ